MNLRSTFWLALLAGLVCPVTAADGSLEAPEHGYVEVVAHDVPFAVGIELGGMAGDDHLQYRLGYALIAHEDMQEFFYTGPVIGARLYSNDDITPFDRDDVDELVLDYLRTFLTAPSLEIAERWHGIYAKHSSRDDFVADVEPGVKTVNGVGGAGMTTSFGLAEEVFEAWG